MFLIGQRNFPGLAICLCIGLIAALLFGMSRAGRAGVNKKRIAAVTALAPLCAMFVSHLLHGLVTAGETLYEHSVWYLLAFWKEGGTVTGAVLGVILAICLLGGKEKWKLLDCYAPGGALMLAAAALGKGFLGQGYGEYLWDESFFMRFPFAVYDADYEAWAWALFLLEMLIALALVIMALRKKPLWQGDGALLVLGLFFSVRIVLESLRRDEFLRWGFVRVEELFAALWVLAALIAYCVKAGPGRLLSKLSCFAAYTALFVFCLLLEFATEGRIDFLLFLDVTGCYTAMALCCAAMAGCVWWMRSLTKPKERNPVS